MEEISKEFATAPVATLAAFVAILSFFGGILFAVARLRWHEPTSISQGGDQPSIDVRASLSNMLLCILIAPLCSVGGAVVSQFFFNVGILTGLLALILLFLLSLTTSAILCGLLFRQWIAVSAIKVKFDDGYFWYKIGDSIAWKFCRRAGQIIAFICVAVFWLILGERFYSTMANFAVEVGNSAASTLLLVLMVAAVTGLGVPYFLGKWAEYLFGLFSQAHKLLGYWASIE